MFYVSQMSDFFAILHSLKLYQLFIKIKAFHVQITQNMIPMMFFIIRIPSYITLYEIRTFNSSKHDKILSLVQIENICIQ